jgi:hypothetical protein
LSTPSRIETPIELSVLPEVPPGVEFDVEVEVMSLEGGVKRLTEGPSKSEFCESPG